MIILTQLQTEKGLKLVLISQLISLILSLVVIISAILFIVGTIAYLGSAGGGTQTDVFSDEEVMAGLGALCALVGLLCLLGLALFIIQVLGIVFIYQGRNEFGEEHAEKARTGGILLIVGVCVSFIPFLGIIGGILTSLGMVFLIIKLAPTTQRTFLWIGFVIGIFGAIANAVNTVMALVKVENEFLLGGMAAVAGLMGIGSAIFMLMAYYGTYKGVKNGIIKPKIQAPVLDYDTYSMPPNM